MLLPLRMADKATLERHLDAIETGSESGRIENIAALKTLASEPATAQQYWSDIDLGVRKVLLGAARLLLRHIRSLDAPQFVLAVLEGEIAGRARAQVSQASKQSRHAGIATRRGNDGFP